MRDIDDADAGLLTLMRQIQHAAAIGPLLDGQAFAAVAIAVEVVMADQDHVVGFRPRLGIHRQNQHAAGKRKNKQDAVQFDLSFTILSAAAGGRWLVAREVFRSGIRCVCVIFV